MSFRYTWILLILLTLICFWLYDLIFRKNNGNSLISFGMNKTIAKELDISKYKLKNNLIIFGSILIALAASGPQIGIRVRPIERKGVDLVIALDTSTSMDAEDVTPSRLEKSKLEIGKLIQNLKGDRVAIIVFAGTSHLYLPLTTDYEAALLFLNEIDSKMIPTQGTVLSAAMQKALETFSNEIDKYKVMLLITDGEDHDNQAIKIASKAASAGFTINTVGVGSKSGSLIPVKLNDQQKTIYKRNKEGNLITSVLNDKILKEISAAGDGEYFWFANSADSYFEIKTAIDNMEKKTISTHEFSEYEDRYQFIGFLSLICFIAGFTVPTRKKVVA